MRIQFSSRKVARTLDLHPTLSTLSDEKPIEKPAFHGVTNLEGPFAALRDALRSNPWGRV